MIDSLSYIRKILTGAIFGSALLYPTVVLGDENVDLGKRVEFTAASYDFDKWKEKEIVRVPSKVDVFDVNRAELGENNNIFKLSLDQLYAVQFNRNRGNKEYGTDVDPIYIDSKIFECFNQNKKSCFNETSVRFEGKDYRVVTDCNLEEDKYFCGYEIENVSNLSYVYSKGRFIKYNLLKKIEDDQDGEN
ncbi:hypothetical protein ACFL1H_02720 [Nanoarchaeota archaeon]